MPGRPSGSSASWIGPCRTAAPPAGTVPILYLPGVSRQDLRAGGDCPASVQPLIELQYRGAVWHQRNGRDWTVEAFLSSEDGLGLDIALDIRTREAVMRALPVLATEPLAPLRGHRLDADDFDRLSVGDPVRDLLGWMSEPDAFQGRCDPARWETFRNICVRDFGFDPDKDGPARAGDLMLNGNGKWESVWRRFRDAPLGYPGIAELLRHAKPRDLFVDRARQPQVNEAQEADLRYALEAALALPHQEICDRILKLEAENRDRRSWVWADLGYSTMAHALEPLSRLAALARSPLGGVSLTKMAADYATEGWRCDRAALDSMNLVKVPSDNALIAKVVRALYVPWLDKSARRFQELATQNEAEYRRLVCGVNAEPETCVVFADGLRFDVAGMLQERLEQKGLSVKLGHRIAPLPTVTATAKPIASPAHSACEGGASSDDFNPVLSASKQSVNAARLRDAMARQGVEILASRGNELSPQDRQGWLDGDRPSGRDGPFTGCSARAAHRHRGRGHIRSRLGVARRLGGRGFAWSPTTVGCWCPAACPRWSFQPTWLPRNGRDVHPCAVSRHLRCRRFRGIGIRRRASLRRQASARSSSIPNTRMEVSACRNASFQKC